MSSRVIHLISYEGVEWSIPIIALTDKGTAEKRAEALNMKRLAGRLDSRKYFSPKLSRFVVTQVNLLEG